MAVEDGVHHGVFGYFLGARFHHHDGVLGTRHGDVHIGSGFLSLGGVDDELAVHPGHHHGGGGAAPGDVAHHQGDGGAQHGGEFRRGVRVHRQSLGHHLHIVAHALVEQGPQGTVDQAAGQGRLFGGAAFPLDEAAGNLTHGILLFFKIHRQGEEIHALPGLVRRGGVHQHGGVAVANQAAAARLLGILAEFQGQGAARKFH